MLDALAKKIRGTRFIHILVPCPPGWKFSSDQTIRLARLAVASRIFPLFEVEEGKRVRLSLMPEKVPIKEYVRLQGRFSHFNDKQIKAFQREVDTRWGELQERPRGYEPSCS